MCSRWRCSNRRPLRRHLRRCRGRLHLPARTSSATRARPGRPVGRLALPQYIGPAFTVATDGTGFQPLGVHGVSALWLGDEDVLIAKGTGHTIVDIPARNGAAPRTLIT